MKIWPAIDLRDGKCVRLRQGDYKQETIFGDDPAAMARRWVGDGAERLHLVDLDGARDGRQANREAIANIVRAIDAPCQLGGGVRDEETIRDLLDVGLARVVIGTKAITDPDWLRRMCDKFPERIVLGIDARDGLVATDGWLETSDKTAVALAQNLKDWPLAAIVYTDIARDGMMAGPNFNAMKEMKEAAAVPVMASGGVTSVDDAVQLARLGLDGCIIGRALYEEEIVLSELFAELAKADDS
ncbi:MAG: 1-(5-phosphoribosyl)-5-[(5-phosphoribosylamino)methylideneamino]imidazole-4-carboxamide isomerase [bacterium]|nr:1-(5-phosphoribosyl)-5-[(5-phosphoribosylamino)methylideneamino]imidazole-4-carboxamide isomerase [bacterium]